MSDIRDIVMGLPLFCHHDHHVSYQEFDAERAGYDHGSLLGYAVADLITAGGPGTTQELAIERLKELWPLVRYTGYGRAVDLGSRELFGLEYEPSNWSDIAAALQEAIRDRSAAEVYQYFVQERAGNRWTIHDGAFRLSDGHLRPEESYPDAYHFAFRCDSLFSMADAGPLLELERFTGQAIYGLDDLVDALNTAIDAYDATGRLVALKVGMAYQRDLRVGEPSRSEAEEAFLRIRNRKVAWDGLQQYAGPVDARASRALGDYMFHRLMERAADDGLAVQIHTGYLAGNWGALEGTRALHLVPILDRYRSVRFDLFHASWPWAHELGALAKNYPNVWVDMCWAWAMNPTESAQALGGWLDGVPVNKIFAYGADTRLPWCNVGYSIQARQGIASALEAKMAAGELSLASAEEIAEHIMLRNGEAFFGLVE